jgi:hypothetical protein
MMKNGLLVVDRFEGSFAVCEQEDGSMIDVDMKVLPEGTREGDVLKFDSGVYAVHAGATTDRTQKIRRLMDKLWRD